MRKKGLESKECPIGDFLEGLQMSSLSCLSVLKWA